MALVTAERLILLYERMNLILGNGVGQSGYGQGQGAGYGDELASYPVSNIPGGNMPNIVSAADVNALYADMVRCRIHQIGITPTEIAELVANLNIIAENTSFFVDNQGDQTVDPDGDKKGIRDFEQLMSSIEADKFLVGPNQTVIEPGISSVRTSLWNGTITHRFTVSFRNADHRRHFFNSGGEIRFTSSNTGAVTAKGQDWGQLLNNIGTVRFNFENTIAETGVGTSAAIGNYQLVGQHQLLYRKIRSGSSVYGSPIYGGVYDGNEYTIEGRSLSPSQIRFRVRFIDVASSGSFNENVDGRIENLIQIRRASSSTGITVPAPTFITVSDL